MFLEISFLNKHHDSLIKRYRRRIYFRSKHSLRLIHGRCTCDRSAVNLFSCHCRHSVDTYNILIKNVLVKNVKSDSKWEINFCSKQSVILSSLSSILTTLNFRRFFISRMRLPHERSTVPEFLLFYRDLYPRPPVTTWQAQYRWGGMTVWDKGRTQIHDSSASLYSIR